MPDTVSVVMPCYNAASTLHEAADSILAQGEILEELIFVDDGSSDDSRSIVEKFLTTDARTRLIELGENRGGGYARNVGIAAARSEAILCFDSDDVLPPGMLRRLFEALRSEDFDGACFSRGESFQRDKRRAKSVPWGEPASVCSIDDVFSGKKWPVGGIFLMKKSAWKTCGGFPVDNNFDTQGFGMRFLKHGLRAVVASDSWFYHRQFAKKKSYFERAYISGEYSLGFLCNLLDLWDLFSDDARKACLTFPFSVANDFDRNVLSELEALNAKNKLFRSKREPDALYEARIEETKENWDAAYERYSALWKSEKQSPFLEYLNLRSHFELKVRRSLRVHEVKEMAMRIFPQPKNYNPFQTSLSERISRKWSRLFPKSKS